MADVVGAATEADHARTELVAGDRLNESISPSQRRLYRPGYRSWTEIKNHQYWRRESEVELVRQQSRYRMGARQLRREQA